ncbi:pyridoxamine 5'-phosphate oxidase family protein [Streptomyces sp. NPDC002588]|uniref:pyridoxamine 5'-phosphate oxidase family protein n=1 Tax=Streptomyces sp. NPDC002588 TaxID=3154419 RepID=UPI003324476E
MSTAPASLPMAEVSGAEALWLPEGSTLGRPVHTQRDRTLIGPGRHPWEYGRLIVRTPAPTAAVPETATYHEEEPGTETGIGRTVTVAGPVHVIPDPDEATLLPCLKGTGGVPVQRKLTGWTHGPHDTLLRLHPRTVSGFRLARAET